MKRWAYRVEIYAGGWVDITADVRGDLAITRGRSSEGYRADPGKLGFRLDNRTGRYAPRNPASDLYGLIGRNTPVRVRAQVTGDSFGRTAGSGWGSVDASTGPAYAWSTFGGGGTVLGTDCTVSGGMGRISVPAAAAYRATWLPTLSIADAVVTVTSGATLAAVTGGPIEPLAVLLRMQSISSYYMARVEVSASEAVTLVLYGPSGLLASVPVPSITWTGQPLRLTAAIVGSQLAAVVWDAAEAEPAGWQVQAPAVDLTPGGVGLRAGVGAGNTNAMPALFAFDDLFVGVGRFYGEIPAWPPRWSLSGADRYVDLDAAGVLRRFRQGDQPALSPMRRTIEGSGPVAYWPGEDGELSGQAGAATSGLSPLYASGTVEFKKVDDYVTFTGSSTTYGTTALADLSAGGELSAQLSGDAVTATASGPWTVHAAILVDTAATLSGDVVVLEWTTASGTYTRWQIKVTTASRTQLLGFTPAGASALLIDHGSASSTFHHYSASAVVSGGTVTVRLQTSNGVNLTAAFAGSLGGVTGVAVNAANTTSSLPMPAGHVAVWAAAPVPITIMATIDAYGTVVRESRRSNLSEAAVDRLIRLAAEVGLDVDVTPADPNHVSRMGVQQAASTTAAIDDAIAVDGGLLYESRDAGSLAYRTRSELYNQTPVAVAYTGQTSPPFDPVDDADDVRNDVTVERRNGSSARAVQRTGPLAAAVPPAGVGVYTTSDTLNVLGDDQLPDQAGWRLHLGTVDEPRYPAITCQLSEPSWLAAPSLRAQLLALDVGGVLEVTGPPAWVSGRVRTLVTGYSETIGEYTWSITFNGAPASPWDVARVGGASRVVARGATLAAGVAAVTPSVKGDFEVNLTGWAGVNGTAVRSTAQAQSGVASALVTPSGSGVVARVEGNASQSLPAVPGQTFVAEGWVRPTTASKPAAVQITWRDSVGAFISSTVATAPATPGVWQFLTVTGTAPAGAASAAPAAGVGSSPTAADTAYVDELRLSEALMLATTGGDLWTTKASAFPLDLLVGGAEQVRVSAITGTASPQVATVSARSVNGVAKAWTAGTSVNVYAPAVVAL